MPERAQTIHFSEITLAMARRLITGRRLAWAILLLTAYLTRFHPILFGTTLLISLGVVFFSIISLCKAIFLKRAFTNQLLVIFSTSLWYVLLIAGPNYFWLERIELSMGASDLASCAARGIEVTDNQKLSVCQIDNRPWRFRFTTAIIYDSSHQIELSHSHRSPQWEEAARHLRGVPFGILGFSAIRLTGNYYAITFLFDQLPDFAN